MFHPGQAFQIAATTLVGQSLGAKDPDTAERCGWQTRNIGVVAVSYTHLTLPTIYSV